MPKFAFNGSVLIIIIKINVPVTIKFNDDHAWINNDILSYQIIVSALPMESASSKCTTEPPLCHNPEFSEWSDHFRQPFTSDISRQPALSTHSEWLQNKRFNSTTLLYASIMKIMLKWWLVLQMWRLPLLNEHSKE